VPVIYTNLLYIDKVGLAISGHATTQVVPAFTVLIQHDTLLLGLFAPAANGARHDPQSFSILVFGA